METPQSQAPKGPRRSARRPKHNSGAAPADAQHTASDPRPSSAQPSQITVQSPDSSVNKELRKHSQNIKKGTTTPKAERAALQQPPPQTQATPTQTRATPIKQAYAGPTFHSSPAPSALPMPSFYSKSMPSIPSVKTPDIAEAEETPDKDRKVAADSAPFQTEKNHKRESTPLDFLFDAARQARGTPRAESPAARSANLSAFGDSPVNRSPAARDGQESMFPFEFDGSGKQTRPIGPSFATPYKERINSLRSANASPSMIPPVLDEDERQIKSEALKRLLMSVEPQRPATTANSATLNNPFNARAPDSRSTSMPLNHVRHRSGPSTPALPPNGYYPQQYLPLNHELLVQGSTMQRPTSSHLRRQYSIKDDEKAEQDSEDSSTQPRLISTARKNGQASRPADKTRNHHKDLDMKLNGVSSTHRSPHSTQQLEDDLRRVLKLDLTSKG